MVFNPLAFATPKQREELEKMQQFTKNVRYIVHTEDSENRVEVPLQTDDPGGSYVRGHPKGAREGHLKIRHLR